MTIEVVCSGLSLLFNLIPVSSQCYISGKSRIVLEENIIHFPFPLLLLFTQ